MKRLTLSTKPDGTIVCMDCRQMLLPDGVWPWVMHQCYKHVSRCARTEEEVYAMIDKHIKATHRPISVVKYVTAAVVAFIISASAAFATDAKFVIHQELPINGPEATFNVLNEDQVYHIVELVEKRPVKYKLFGIGEKNYWVYRTVDTKYPVVLSPELHDKLKNDLKDVPDNRVYSKKYPHRFNTQETTTRWGGPLGIVFGLVLTVTTGMRGGN